VKTSNNQVADPISQEENDLVMKMLASIDEGIVQTYKPTVQVEESLNTHKPQVEALVVEVINRPPSGGNNKPWKKLTVKVNDPTALYPKSTQIESYKKVLIADVDKETNTLAIFSSKMPAYDENYQHFSKDGREMVEKLPPGLGTLNGKEAFLITPGMQFEVAVENASLDGVVPHSTVYLGLTVTRYFMKDQPKPTINYGVSLKCWELRMIYTPTLSEIMKVYMTNKDAFNLPLPTVAQLFEKENYVYVQSASEDARSKKTSDRQFSIPHIPKQESFLLFGRGPGLITHGVDMQGPKCFGTLNKEKEWNRTLSGSLVVSQYKTLQELIDYGKNNKPLSDAYRFDFKIWGTESCLDGFKIRGRELWTTFMPTIMHALEFVLTGKAALYETAERQGSSEGQFFFQLKAAALAYNFSDYIRRNGIPLSPVAVKTLVANNDPRLASWYKPTEDVEKGLQPYQVSFNQLDGADHEVLNLNEWNETRKAFLDLPTTHEKYDFFALTQSQIGSSTLDTLREVEKYAAGKGPEIALGDPLIFTGWKPRNPEPYAQFSGTKVPPDHPLIVDNIQTLVANQNQLIIVFAVKRASAQPKKHANAPQIADADEEESEQVHKKQRTKFNESDEDTDSVD
jgi:hypothetical protein